jgi:hypothetical protein
MQYLKKLTFLLFISSLLCPQNIYTMEEMEGVDEAAMKEFLEEEEEPEATPEAPPEEAEPPAKAKPELELEEPGEVEEPEATPEAPPEKAEPPAEEAPEPEVEEEPEVEVPEAEVAAPEVEEAPEVEAPLEAEAPEAEVTAPEEEEPEIVEPAPKKKKDRPTPRLRPARKEKEPTPIKVAKPEREISLKEKEEIKELPGDAQKIIQQANQYESEIQKEENKIGKIASDLNKEQRDIDEKIDKFHKKISKQLARFGKRIKEIGNYLEKKLEPSKEKAKIEEAFEIFEKEQRKIMSNVERVATREKNLHESLKLLRTRQSDASISAAKARKIKDGITKKPDQSELNELIKISGEIKEAGEAIGDIEKTVKKEIKTIEKLISETKKSVSKIKSQSKKMKKQIEKAGEEEAKAAQKEEEAILKKIESEMEQARKEDMAELRWYERILASIARGIIKIRDALRDIFGLKRTKEDKQFKTTDEKTTGTAVEQLDAKIEKLELQKEFAVRMQKKLKTIEEEKNKLLEQLKSKEIPVYKEKKEVDEKKSIVKILNQMLSNFFELIKEGFLAIGRTINKALSRAASWGRGEETET